MSAAQLKTTLQGGLILSGSLDFSTTAILWQQSKTLLKAASIPIDIDLSAVTQSDSSGVALLIAWQRYAHQLQKEIYFSNVPTAMQAIIRVSELENILSIKAR